MTENLLRCCHPTCGLRFRCARHTTELHVEHQFHSFIPRADDCDGFIASPLEEVLAGWRERNGIDGRAA